MHHLSLSHNLKEAIYLCLKRICQTYSVPQGKASAPSFVPSEPYRLEFEPTKIGVACGKQPTELACC